MVFGLAPPTPPRVVQSGCSTAARARFILHPELQGQRTALLYNGFAKESTQTPARVLPLAAVCLSLTLKFCGEKI